MLKYFFSNWKDIPSQFQWKAYSFEYWIWIFILVSLIVIMAKIYKKSNHKSEILKGIALLVVFQEIVKDILHYMAGSLELEHLPFHLCGISIFMITWHAFSKNKLNTEFIYALTLPGALMALAFPNWTQYPIVHFSSVNSFTIHTWLIMYVVIQLYGKTLKPDFKNLKYTFLFTLCLMVPIYFLNKAWDTNFFFINTPSPGSPLIGLYQLFGNGYVVALILLFIVLWILMYIPWINAYENKGYSKNRKLS
ncbi:MAG: TIGR02206 family membrane protein [Floccifex sp.]